MKRTFFTVIMLTAFIFTLPAEEHYGRWLSGTVSFSGQSNGQRQSATTIMPEIGFYLSDSWSAGVKAGFSTSRTKIDNNVRSENAFSIMPFAKYNFGKLAGISVFGQGELPLTFTGGKHYDGSSMDGTTAVGFRIRPGISYLFSERWGFKMLMPPVINFTSSDGSSSYKLGFNDGYTIQNYLLNTSIGFIYMF
ncbi:MAG: transporter [Bacteroidales bacterium]